MRAGIPSRFAVKALLKRFFVPLLLYFTLFAVIHTHDQSTPKGEGCVTTERRIVMTTLMQEVQIEHMSEVNSIAGALPDQTERPVNHPSICCSTAASAKEVSPTTFKGLSK